MSIRSSKQAMYIFFIDVTVKYFREGRHGRCRQNNLAQSAPVH